MKRWLAVFALALVAACGDSNEPGTPVTAFISSVTGGGATATVVSGTPPAAANFNGVQVFCPSSVTKGTTVNVDLSAAGQTFTRVYVQISGMNRYYQLDLPAAVTSITMAITLTSSIAVSNFEFVFGLSSSLGQNYGTQTVTVS
jgi:hypothetical protein